MSPEPTPLTPLPAEGCRKILAEHVKKGSSGLLVLTRQKVRITLCLVHGRPRFPITNLRRFQPQIWLAGQGLAPEAKLLQLRPTLPGTLGLLQALVEAGLGTRQQLLGALQKRMRGILREALAWTSGEWRFDAGNPVLDHEILLDDLNGALLDKGRLNATHTNHSQSPQAGPANHALLGSLADADPVKAADPARVERLLNHYREQTGLDFYQLLGVGRDADMETTRTAYHSLARLYHPDTLRGAERSACLAPAEEYFATVTEAYNTLTRPALRAEYDENLQINNQEGTSTAAQDPALLARAHYRRGRQSRQEGKLHEAHEFFSNAVSLDPGQPEYHRELGILQMQNPHWRKKAESSLKRTLELQPTDISALAHLGQLYMQNGLQQRAAHCYKTALGWDPTCQMALEGLQAMESGSQTRSDGRRSGWFKRK